MTSPWRWTPFPCNLFWLACLFLPYIASAADQQPGSYVEDRAGVMGGEARSALAGLLQELEQKTGAQFVILTVPSTEGVPIEQFSLERAEQWGLGRKGKDNGLLLVIAVQDRKYRFETGYGLEQVLPDSLLGSIGRRYMVPRFRMGDYAGGITDAATLIARTIADAEGVKLEGLPETKRSGQSKDAPLGPLLVFLIAAFILVSLSRYRRTRGLAEGALIGSVLGGRGSRGSGGFGSFGGGGFGSFGGGGGGGFGGGGASGGW